MPYWLTAEWPRRALDAKAEPPGAWIEHAKRSAGADLLPGDRVFVYETASGPTRVEARGRTNPCLPGRQGIVAAGRFDSAFMHFPGSRRERYANGTARTRCCGATIAPSTLDRTGFVPREVLNRVLGHAEGYAHPAGTLRKLTKEQAERLLVEFARRRQFG